jgi:heme exporter protein B
MDLPTANTGLASRALAVYMKDLRLELRSRAALNALFLFAISTLAVISFSLGQAGLSPRLLSALYWVVLFFSAMSGLAHVFVREEESGTAMALRLHAQPEAVLIGKLLLNVTILVLLGAVVTPLFFVFTNLPETADIVLFVLLAILGIGGLCAASTLVGAIIARSTVRGALFAVLAFPVLVPLLLVVVGAGDKALSGQAVGELSAELQFLIAYLVAMTVGSVMLFRFVWND